MALSEFEIIRRYFDRPVPAGAGVRLGIGDDAALLDVPPGQCLVTAADVLVAGRHFAAGADPEGVGHKALAVNLSDLAAMGAEPAWATLGLALPQADENWLAGFCRGLFGLAARFGVQLVGGDTTRGPLNVSIQVHGLVPPGAALRRDRARPGDVLCVTGTPGDAGLALALRQGETTIAAACRDYLDRRLDRPLPRIRQGLELRGLASAAIDVSDGLAQDLGHVLARSGVGARLDLQRLPRSAALATLDEAAARHFALAGGDDYELCFTVPPRHLARVRALAADWDCRFSEIGIIEAEPGLRYAGAALEAGDGRGYDHFA